MVTGRDDITGGAPEMHLAFRPLVLGARALGKEVIDRCNLTVLEEPGFDESKLARRPIAAGAGVRPRADALRGPCVRLGQFNAGVKEGHGTQYYACGVWSATLGA